MQVLLQARDRQKQATKLFKKIQAFNLDYIFLLNVTVISKIPR